MQKYLSKTRSGVLETLRTSFSSQSPNLEARGFGKAYGNKLRIRIEMTSNELEGRTRR